MHEWFCGSTAFHCLRTPPQVKSLYPLFPDIGFPAGKRQIKLDYNNSAGWANVLGPLPLHAIVRDPQLRRPSLVVKPRVWTGDLPAGAFYDYEDLGITYASPAFTVFTMAPQLSITQMIMAMYELTGLWGIYRPNQEIQTQIDHMENTRLAWVGGWQQVRTTRGLATSLWKRGPLITTHELLAFARGISGMRNAQKYLRAAARVQGNTASPLEARLSMLLSLPPREGGEGFPPFLPTTVSPIRTRRPRSPASTRAMRISSFRPPKPIRRSTSNVMVTACTTGMRRVASTPIAVLRSSIWASR